MGGTMSIVLLGSTSGSITLQEPAVAGSNTINLPAATGTAVLTGVSGTVDINAAGSNNVTLSTNSTERVRVDSSGNVGIGTTSPVYRLDLNNASTYTTIGLRQAGTLYGYVEGGISIVKLGTNAAIPLAFELNGTERMRITSGGDVGINNTGLTGCRFAISEDGSVRNAMGINNTASGSGSQAFVSFQRNTTQTGTISNTNSATAYNTSSDYRLKENIAPMTGALATVAQLKPVTYTWKIDGSAGQGFIAHELQAVVPDAVTGEKDAVETYTDEDGNEQTRIKPQGVDTSFLVATLTAAIQELKGIVDTQATKIAELEAKLEGTA